MHFNIGKNYSAPKKPFNFVILVKETKVKTFVKKRNIYYHILPPLMDAKGWELGWECDCVCVTVEASLLSLQYLAYEIGRKPSYINYSYTLSL